MVITDISIIHHVGIVLILLWLLNSYNCCHPIVYFVSLIYLFQVHERYSMRLKRKLQFKERKAANQRRVLTDSETVRWLNHAVAKMWPICIEQIVSQQIFLPIIPWFLKKYKPWTVKRASVQSLYLGRTPPLFTDIRVLQDSSEDDHLVLELGLNFLTADDMSATLVAKLRRRLGFGIVTKMHLTGLHVEGRVLIGIKFLRSWPFIGRLRICFAEPPYFQMIVKPVFHHGLDVTELPGIAGWLDNLLAIAFEETLVEPNMLVVDLEKFVSPKPETWFSVDVKETVAQVNVEVIEAAELKPTDFNGLADPYVKGRLGPYRLRSQILKKTLTPKWLEEFKVPIFSWDTQNILEFEVRDKDRFVDDILGNCSVNVSELRDGQRHDMWLPLQDVKMGRLHLAITVKDTIGKEKKGGEEVKSEGEKPNIPQSEKSEPGPTSDKLPNKSQKIADTFEAINVEGQKDTGIWVQHPGSEISRAWEPRKGKSRVIDSEITSRHSSLSDSSSDDDSKEGTRKRENIFKWGFQKIFRRHSKKDHSNSFRDRPPSPRANVKPVHVKRVGVVMGDAIPEPTSVATTGPLGGSSNGENLGNLDVEGVVAGNSKSGLSRKETSKFFEESAEGGPLEFDSSDDEISLSSSFHDSSLGAIPVSSTFISRAANEAEPDVAVLTEARGDIAEGLCQGAGGEQNIAMIDESEDKGEVLIDESTKPNSLVENDGQISVEATKPL